MRNLLKLLNQINKECTKAGDLYFKHFSFFDLEKTQEYYYDSIEKLKSQGILTNEEKLEQAKENGYWSDSQEAELKLIPTKVSNLKKAKNNLVLPVQAERLNKDIETCQKNLRELQYTKDVIQYQSAEYFANSWTIQFQIYLAVFNDDNLTQKPWSYEEYEDLEDSEYGKIQKEYFSYLEDFDEENLKRLSISPYFRNIYDLGNPYKIFDKPLIELTIYQNQLLLYAKNYNLIFKNSSSIPPELMDKPNELEAWFIKEQQQQKNSPKSQPRSNNLLKPGLASQIKEKGKMNIQELNKLL